MKITNRDNKLSKHRSWSTLMVQYVMKDNFFFSPNLFNIHRNKENGIRINKEKKYCGKNSIKSIRMLELWL